jgi:predicted esterase
LLVAPVSAQRTAVTPGVVLERAVSPSDSTQSYAVYLPPAYDAARHWPILFLLDPRGRALVPLELFRPAAEANGWILMSSYNSLSDGPAEPNVRAMNAMLRDARASFSIDRLYIGGFSGTARLAWEFAAQLDGAAGLFGASASVTPRAGMLPSPPAKVPFFGTAGKLDFNHDEVIRFEKRLEGWSLPHRIRVFDGAHQWPPAELAAEALEWFDLQAMRSGKLPADTARIRTWHARDSAAIASLSNAGRRAEALSRAHELLADYRGLRDTTAAARLVRQLSSDRDVRAQQARQRELFDENAARDRRLYEYMDRVRAMARPPRAEDAIRELDVRSLQRQALGTDTARALAAGRALEQIFVAASFYMPREFMAKGEAARALVMLEIAAAIHADHPQVLLNRARALVSIGRLDDARRALDRAFSAGIRADAVRGDSLLSRIIR